MARLVLFFIFAAASRVYAQARDASGAAAIAHRSAKVLIDKAGAMELNRQLVSMAKLPTVLAREKETTRSLTLIIRTDKKTRHGLVLEVMEVAKRLDVDKVVLATEEEEI